MTDTKFIRRLQQLPTEQPNPRSADLDTKSSLAIARIINDEDATVARAVRRALPQVARGIDCIAQAISQGGRLIYVGAGTSGRIAALDAAECPPTFATPPHTVQFIMAGGNRALGTGLEANEDSTLLGKQAILKHKPTRNDVIIGIAASGRTPFTIAAVQTARRAGATTIAITSNPGSPLEKAADFAIVVQTGPEVVSGSTRMKAGTAEKLVLNMLSTGAMVRLGYVYGNLMVNLRGANTKLSERSVTILQRAVPMERNAARAALKSAHNSLPVAIVMQSAGVSRAQAQKALAISRGHVRRALALASRLQQNG
jgi:N-acetylmuramic acid 6-phosphate etherase